MSSVRLDDAARRRISLGLDTQGDAHPCSHRFAARLRLGGYVLGAFRRRGKMPQVISTGDITSPKNHEVISTGDITSPENHEVASTGDATSPLAGGERREREKSPHTPLKEKGQETSLNARARGMVFTKPTVEEVAALTAGV